MSELPSGWAEVALADLSQKIGSGSTPTGGKTAYKDAGVPLIRSMNIHFSGFTDNGLAYLDKNQAKKLESVSVTTGDVLLNITGASIGRVTIAPARMNGARVNQHVAIIRPANGIDSEFVSRYLSSPQMQRIIGQENYGVTRQALTKAMIKEFRIPFPPLGEQRRIAAKIESLSAKSQRARYQLVYIPLLVEKYKQAILAAAFRGELTHGWRMGRNASVSVEELEALRSNAWKVEREHGRVGGRYVPAKSIDWQPALEVPKEWTWASVDQISMLIQYGSSAKTSEDQLGVAVLRMGNIQDGALDQTSLKFLPEDHHEFPELLLERGDVLFNRTNSAELVGKTAVYNGKPQKASFASYLIRVRCCGLLPILLSGYINSAYGREWVANVVNQQVGSGKCERHKATPTWRSNYAD